MSRIEQYRVPAALAATFALGLGAAACGNSPSTAKGNTDPTISVGTSFNQGEHEAQELCEQPATTPNHYVDFAGANQNLVKAVGSVVDGQQQFNSANVNVTAQEEAKVFATNDAGIAVVSQIIGASTGITSSGIAEAVNTNVLPYMEASQSNREAICEPVIERMLDTPSQRELQSASGKLIIYAPEFDTNKDLDGVNPVSSPNTTQVEVFNIAPLAGSKHPALDENIFKGWGVTPTGQIIQEQAINASGASSGGGEQPNSSAQSNNSGNETGSQSGGTGASNKEGRSPSSSGTSGSQSNSGGGGAVSVGEGSGATGSGTGTGGSGSGSGGEGGGGGAGGGSGSGSGGSGGGEGGGGTPPTTAPPETTLPPTTTTTTTLPPKQGGGTCDPNYTTCPPSTT